MTIDRPEKTTPATDEALRALDALTPAERVEVMRCYCGHCGEHQPAKGMRCQCDNDE